MSDKRFKAKNCAPEMDDFFDAFQRKIMMEMNCHAIATVQSFDPTTASLTAKVNYGKTFSKTDSNGMTIQYQEDYPLMIDCPIIIMGGGKFTLTFPIAVGDQCMILFNDRDMDNWFSGAANNTPLASSRLHSFSDAVAMVGMFKVPSYDAYRSVLTDGVTKIALGKSGGSGSSLVEISNSNGTLFALLGQLISDIQTMVGHVKAVSDACAVISIPVVPWPLGVAGAPVPTPTTNAASFTSASAQLATDSTTLGTDSTNIGKLLL